MLEGLVANLLNRFLGMYVKNFDPTQLNVGIWSGDVSLRNLELKKEALDQLQLPVNVVEGYLGQLTMSIPWTNLRGKPVRVEISDIFVLAMPQIDGDSDDERVTERQVEAKLKRLENAELLKSRSSEGMSLEDQHRNQTFAESVTAAIVDNLQISIKNIHIRYEDALSSPGFPFAVGLELREVSAVSTDDQWNPKYIQGSSDAIYKLAKLDALSLYWNTRPKLYKHYVKDRSDSENQSIAMQQSRLSQFFSGFADNQELHQFMLKPVTGRALLQTDKTGTPDKAHVKARLLFDSLGVQVDDEQYKSALLMVDLFHFSTLHQEHKNLLPKCSVTDDPRAWFRFGVEVVLAKIQQRNRQWTWAYLVERRDSRKLYIELFKKTKKNISLSANEQTEMKGLEAKLSYEDLRFWRSLARNQLRKENVGVKQVAPKQTWTQWAFGVNTENQGKDETNEDTSLTTEQRQELYAAIDWDEKKALSEEIDVSPSSIKLQVEAFLQTGSFVLQRRPHTSPSELMSVYFDDLSTKLIQRPESLLTEVSLGGMRINDNTTPHSRYPQILNFRPQQAARPPSEASKSLDAAGDSLADLTITEERAKNKMPLLDMSFERNPLDKRADSSLVVRLKGFEFVYNPNFVRGLMEFLKPSEYQMESVGALLESAGATVEELKQQTRAGLEFALEEHKTLDANLDIQAPLIIIPEDITDIDAICLVIDAGHVSVKSELIERSEITDLQAKHDRGLSAEEFHHLEDLMYDKFILQLHSTQVLLGKGIESVKSRLVESSGPLDLHLVRETNMIVHLGICIASKSSQLPVTRLSGHLPNLHCAISDHKYKCLMRILDLIASQDEVEAINPPPKSNNTSRTIVPQSRTDTSNILSRQRSISASVDPQDFDSDDEELERKMKLGAKDPAQPSIQRQKFAIKFNVNEFRASLYQELGLDGQNSLHERRLVDIVAQNFVSSVSVQTLRIEAMVNLGHFYIEDHVEPDLPAEFQRLIFGDEVESTAGNDFLTVHYSRQDPTVLELDQGCEGIMTSIDTKLSKLNLIVTRNTLLTMLDFVLATFTTSDHDTRGTTSMRDENETLDGTVVQGIANANGLGSRINITLDGITMILNDDGSELATISLLSGTVCAEFVDGAMDLQTHLGNLVVLEKSCNDGTARDLIDIEGQRLMDFRYRTVSNEPRTDAYDAYLTLRSGSIKVFFLEKAVHSLLNFSVKFGQMQAMYSAARLAAQSQAQKIQQTSERMKLDIVISTPIIIFPDPVTQGESGAAIIAQLGEIFVKNQAASPSVDTRAMSQVHAGIRNIRLLFKSDHRDELCPELDMIEAVNLDMKLSKEKTSPALCIDASLSPFTIRIDELQIHVLLNLAASVPNALALTEEATMSNPIDRDVEEILSRSISSPSSGASVSNLKGAVKPSSDDYDGQAENKTIFTFRAPTCALELMLAINDHSRTRFSCLSFNQSKLSVWSKSNGTTECKLGIASMLITDNRNRESNRFTNIMSHVDDHDQVSGQLEMQISISGCPESSVVSVLVIESPRIMLAFDWLLELQRFWDKATGQQPSEISERASTTKSVGTISELKRPIAEPKIVKPDPSNSETPICFRIDVKNAQLILVADSASQNSEAIVLSMQQILLSQQNALTIQVSKVGLYLCRMDEFRTSQLRLLDDFSMMCSSSHGSPSSACTTNMSLEIEPLVLRLSLRDVLLVMQILQKATEVVSRASAQDSKHSDQRVEESFQIRSSKPPPISDHEYYRKSLDTGISSQQDDDREMQKQGHRDSVHEELHEELIATVGGLRFVLIGDSHELPLLDMNVEQFDVKAQDWSQNLQLRSTFDTHINVYNFSKSAWEPLFEPWRFSIDISQRRQLLSVELCSNQVLEMTFTTATIALLSKTVGYLQDDTDVLSKPRSCQAPFRLRNHTGFDLMIWDELDNHKKQFGLSDGEERPWRFEDPTSIRQNLEPEGHSGLLNAQLVGSGFDSITRIRTKREGEELYILRPKKDKILHRMMVETALGNDNIKNITFRSPLVIENNTDIPISVGVFSPEEGHLLKVEQIVSGQTRSAPIGAAFIHSLVLRPDDNSGYTWSNNRLFWKEMLKSPSKTVVCNGKEGSELPSFYLRVHAAYDRKNPTTASYPIMRIRIFAPIVVQNLLPYDFNFRIYDKDSSKDWTSFLQKGGACSIHTVDLLHLLLINVMLIGSSLDRSEFAIINGGTNRDFSREDNLQLKDKNNSVTNLRLQYFAQPQGGGAFKISVYSPYLILNKTGQNISIQSKNAFASSRNVAEHGLRLESGHGARKSLPYMFSYPSKERKNRASIRVEDSAWSKPQSFDAIGSVCDVVLPSIDSQTEMSVGISVAEGSGMYNLTKIVTIAPRFVLKNKTQESLGVRAPGSTNILSLQPDQLRALPFVRKMNEKRLCLSFIGEHNHWTSPFDICEVGTVHVKIAKAHERQQLIRVEIIMEAATLFLHLSIEKSQWPFTMRNESDVEFTFHQADPTSTQYEQEHGSKWKPIRYRLPAKSIMPYAWDYPASQLKEIVLVGDGKERNIKLAEIGNLVPMKFSREQGQNAKIIDINIIAEGPTQVLILSNFKQAKSLYAQRSPQATSSRTSLGSSFEVKDQPSEVFFKAQLKVFGLGISLVNANGKELLHLTLRDIDIKYHDSRLYQTLNSSIKWIQIDNQLYGGIFPILLYPSVVPKIGKELEAHPILHSMITRVKDESYGVLYIKYFTLLLQQITLEVDEDFIFALLDFVKCSGSSLVQNSADKLCDETLSIPEPQQEQHGRDVYFELLQLQPMQLDLSFVRTEHINAEDRASSSNPFMFLVNIMTMSVGNVNDAPLRLNALIIENARISTSALVANVQSHYTQECLRQVHIILGSADFLGNPVGLFNNVSSGVADIFYEPYQGLVMTDKPQELGIGIAKGASSFVKKSVFGLSDSMAKFTGSMSKGLAAATLDKEFQDQRRISRARNRPKHALYGVTSGGNAFANSLASGIGGLARHPIQGAEKEGFEGFMKGIGKGFLGLATKPAIGAFDLASNMAEGVRNTTTAFDQEGLDRVRLTRFIGLDGVVRPYSEREALGQFWLKTLDGGKFFEEDYVAHLELSGKDILIMLTYTRIMLVKSKRLKSEWSIKLSDVQTISKERTGMNITLKGGSVGPFVPVVEEESRNWLYKQIAIAVNAFNDRYNAGS